MQTWIAQLMDSATTQRARHKGLELCQLRMLIEIQGGLCALCDQQLDRYHIDHDHCCCGDTNEYGDTRSCGQCVRGLLCGSCNHGIGFLRESAALLSPKVIEYTQPPHIGALVSRTYPVGPDSIRLHNQSGCWCSYVCKVCGKAFRHKLGRKTVCDSLECRPLVRKVERANARRGRVGRSRPLACDVCGVRGDFKNKTLVQRRKADGERPLCAECRRSVRAISGDLTGRCYA